MEVRPIGSDHCARSEIRGSPGINATKKGTCSKQRRDISKTSQKAKSVCFGKKWRGIPKQAAEDHPWARCRAPDIGPTGPEKAPKKLPHPAALARPRFFFFLGVGYLDSQVAIAFFKSLLPVFWGKTTWKKAIATGDPGTLHFRERTPKTHLAPHFSLGVTPHS